MATGTQPRGHHAPALLPEFSYVARHTFDENERDLIMNASQRALATDLELESTTLRAKGKVFDVQFGIGVHGTSVGGVGLPGTPTGQPPSRLHIGHFDVHNPAHLYIGRRHVDRQGRLFRARAGPTRST